MYFQYVINRTNRRVFLIIINIFQLNNLKIMFSKKRNRKLMKLVGVLMQVAVIINVSFLGVLISPTQVFATANPGAIWTTRNDCGSSAQDVNEFNAGEHDYINGSGFAPGTYDWFIEGQPGSADPNIKVALGTKTVDSSGKFCFDAYLVLSGDDGVYKTDFNGKNDNYHVNGITSLDNPPLGQSCGIDIALVLDSSGSINDSNLTQMKNSFKGFVDSMLPSTPTQFSVTDFDFTGTVITGFSNNVSTVKTAIDVPTSGGATNWEDALLKSSGTFDPRLSVPNLIIFASDGNPTVNNGPGGGDTGWLTDGGDLTRAITQANLIKSAGTRIITLGIGSSVTQANLEAISSADAYFSAANFSVLTETLHQITTELCGGTITVHKIIDQDGDLQTTEDQTPGAGWQFNVAGADKTTDQDGQTVPKEVEQGSYDVTESVQNGYTLVDASCKGATENNGSLDGNTIYGIQVEDSDVVTCAFYNSPKPGILTVYKQVYNTYGGDASPLNFTIEVSNGAPSSFPGSADGVLVTIPAGDSFNVSETGGPAGYSMSLEGNCSGTMPRDGRLTCTVKNDQLDPHADEGMITVIKNVVNDNGGTATATAFTLYVDDTTVTNGDSNYFDTGDYTISEDSLPGYTNTSVICRDGEETVSQDGDISLAAGQAITCTITNNDIQPKLTVVKWVVGGEAQISDFPLYVTLGQNEPVAVTSGQANGFDAGNYVVSEINQQSNYSASFSENCPNGQISLSVGDDKTCTITNTYRAPTYYSVHGYKWNDANNNGQYDCPDQSCESKLPGWTIFLDLDEDKQLDENELRTVTASGEELGWYWFDNLPAGSYSICEQQQNGWGQTYPAEASCHNITLPNESPYTLNAVYAPEYNFGNHQNQEEPPTPPPTPPGGGGGGGGCTGDCGPSTLVLGSTLKPNLTVSKTVNKETVYAGVNNVEYTVTVENTGNTSAFNVLLTDKLPAGITFSDGSTEKSWDIGELKAGEKRTIAYLVNVAASMATGSYVNAATVTATGIAGISAKATLKVTEPQVLGEKLPYTGFDSKEFVLLFISMAALFMFGRKREQVTN
jgi:uncharacterized repeat protein (TIGR01451 family)